MEHHAPEERHLGRALGVLRGPARHQAGFGVRGLVGIVEPHHDTLRAGHGLEARADAEPHALFDSAHEQAARHVGHQSEAALRGDTLGLARGQKRRVHRHPPKHGADSAREGLPGLGGALRGDTREHLLELGYRPRGERREASNREGLRVDGAGPVREPRGVLTIEARALEEMRLLGCLNVATLREDVVVQLPEVGAGLAEGRLVRGPLRPEHIGQAVLGLRLALQQPVERVALVEDVLQ